MHLKFLETMLQPVNIFIRQNEKDNNKIWASTAYLYFVEVEVFVTAVVQLHSSLLFAVMH